MLPNVLSSLLIFQWGESAFILIGKDEPIVKLLDSGRDRGLRPQRANHFFAQKGAISILC